MGFKPPPNDTDLFLFQSYIFSYNMLTETGKLRYEISNLVTVTCRVAKSNDMKLKVLTNTLLCSGLGSYVRTRN